MATIRLAAALTTLSLSALLSTSAHAATCTDAINPSSPVLSNGFAFNTSNTRQQASNINADNVATLSLAYVQVADGATDKKGAPAVTEQTVYFSEGRDIVAANRTTGCQYWRYSGVNKTTLGIKNAIRSSAIAYLPAAGTNPPVVFAGDFNGNLYAVHAVTGKQLWKAFVGTDANHHMITGAPLPYNGTLYVPVASKEVITTVTELFSACCSTHGLLQALDPYTGKIKWTYHTAPVPAAGAKRANGMSLWGAPMIDAANPAIVVGTGQHYSPPYTNNSDSIISLDLDTGHVNWIFQATQGDAWTFACVVPKGLDGHCKFTPGGDFDFGAPPMLVQQATGEWAIIAGSKSGTVYSLKPNTGELNWQTSLGLGGALGGVHWGMATDKSRIFAAVADLWINKFKRLSLSDAVAFQRTLGANTGAVPGGKPGIYALDINTGHVVWERHFKHDYQGTPTDSIFSAALSVTNNVLLASNLNGEVKALRTSDGEELWTFNTAIPTVDVGDGKAGKGGTIDSVGAIPAGSDLLINSGYSSFGGATAWHAGEGNSLFVLRLP
jgi:polyvinyl alcohol dehydrogenase (cytochrome)